MKLTELIAIAKVQRALSPKLDRLSSALEKFSPEAADKLVQAANGLEGMALINTIHENIEKLREKATDPVVLGKLGEISTSLESFGKATGPAEINDKAIIEAIKGLGSSLELLKSFEVKEPMWFMKLWARKDDHLGEILKELPAVMMRLVKAATINIDLSKHEDKENPLAVRLVTPNKETFYTAVGGGSGGGGGTAPVQAGFIATVDMPSANTEYSYTFNEQVRVFRLKLRSRSVDLKIAFATGDIAGGNYLTVNSGGSIGEDVLKLMNGKKIYLATTTTSQTAEIVYWL